MTIVRTILAALLLAVLSVAGAATAGAQADDDYPVTTPTSEVLDEQDERDEDDGDNGGVSPDSDESPTAQSDDTEVLSSGSSRLPVTGGELAGLTVVGLAAIAVGTALVLRRRTASST